MPDDRIKISALSSPLTISDDAKLPISQENGGVQTTFGAEMTQIAVKIGEGTTFSTLNLPVGQAKTLVNAINYILEHGGGTPWTDIIDTLEAGETTLTISNAVITTDSTIEVYPDVFGVAPTNQVVTEGQIVLTFEAQEDDIRVKVRVS